MTQQDIKAKKKGRESGLMARYQNIYKLGYYLGVSFVIIILKMLLQ